MYQVFQQSRPHSTVHYKTLTLNIIFVVSYNKIDYRQVVFQGACHKSYRLMNVLIFLEQSVILCMADTRDREANEIAFPQTLDFVNMVRVNSAGLNICLTLQNITDLHSSTCTKIIA